jgi:cytochrome P450
MWFGPTPRVNIMNPEQLKDVLSKISNFQKIGGTPLTKLLVSGLAQYEAEKWAKHRKIINPAFHLEKLKVSLLQSI